MKAEKQLFDQNGNLLCTLHIRQEARYHDCEYNQLKKRFSSSVAELSKISINADGTVVNDDDTAILERAETYAQAFLSEWLEPDEVATIFAVHKPFSSVNGGFYVMQVLNTINLLRGGET